VIRSGSESIYPEDVEKVLMLHPNIEEAVVIGVSDERWGEVPKALMVVKKGKSITKEEITSYCMDKLAKYKIPKYIEFIESIPKTSAGKILRRQLAEKYGTE